MSEPVQKGEVDLRSLDQALNESETASDLPSGSLEHKSDTLSQPPAAAPSSASKKQGDSPATLSPSSARSLSPRPAAAAASPNQPLNALAQGPNEPTPALTELKGMFPDLDQDTIAAVLSSRGGNQEAAVNALLQMSDPEFKPSQHDTQTDSDALLAQTLALEEEQRHQARFTNQQGVQPSLSNSGGRGGGGAGSFFSGLLSSNTNNNSSNETSSQAAPTYDPNALTYQPRVRKPAVSPGQRAAYGAPPAAATQMYAPNANYPTDQSAIPGMPGPKEAKQWQEEINKMAETGLARAASTFSLLKQKANAAFNAPPQEGGAASGASGSEGGNGSGKADGSSTTGGFAQGFPGFRQSGSAGTGKSSSNSLFGHASPRSPNASEYDQDPSPVSENELAKIISRGSSSGGAGRGAVGGAVGASGGGGNKAKALAQRYGLGIQKSSSTSSTRGGSSGGEKADQYGWEDAGRAPISIKDNTSASSLTNPSTASKDSIALMDGAAGRGITSPRARSPTKEHAAISTSSSSKDFSKDGASTPTTATAGASQSGQTATPTAAKHEDGNDSDDLEYVSNPFEDED